MPTQPQTFIVHGKYNPAQNAEHRTIGVHVLNNNLIPAGAIPLRCWYKVNEALTGAAGITLKAGLNAGGSDVMFGAALIFSNAVWALGNHYPALLTATTGASPTAGAGIIVTTAVAVSNAVGDIDFWVEYQRGL